MSSLDDIPEETILSGKSSEEKEIIRVDSGLGEWDSESSRKTSFSSQGRLSPDFPMEKTSKVRLVIMMMMMIVIVILQESLESGGRGEAGKNGANNNKSSAKRRRSGIDMVGNGRTPVLANGQVNVCL